MERKWKEWQSLHYFFCFGTHTHTHHTNTPTLLRPGLVQCSMRENPGNLLAYPVITSIMLRGVLASRLRAVYTPSRSRGVGGVGWGPAARILWNDTVAISVPLSECLNVCASGLLCVLLFRQGLRTKNSRALPLNNFALLYSFYGVDLFFERVSK